MSNQVDFYLSQEQRSAAPAGRCVVSVDGVLCPYLSVKGLVRGSVPEYSRARLTYNPAVWPGGRRIAPEDIEKIAPVGRRVCVAAVYDGGMGQTAVETVPLFAGRIEQIETKVGGDRQTVEIIAKDFAAQMARVTLFGQRIVGCDARTMRLPGRDLVFNPNGLPNASAAVVQHAGLWYRVFSDDPSRAAHWTCAAAVRYLLCEHLVTAQIGMPSIEQLQGLFANRTLPTLDATAMNLLQAVEHCCKQTGVKFRFEPCEPDAAHDQQIVFYRPGAARTVELNHQKSGERFDITRTNVCRLASTRRFGPVTHRFIGRGGWKTYEATFALVKAWDPSLEGGPQDLYAPSTNSDFPTVRNVCRRWCLNEAGDYSGPPYNRGEAFDFSRIFERADYVQHRRRFQNALTSQNGEPLGYYLQMSCDSGATWQAYTASFDLLDDQCGIWLSSDQLSAELWSAIAADTLKFRITAAVQSDTRLEVSVANGPVNSAAEVLDHLVEANDLQYKKVSSASAFYGAADADERDDTEALHALVRQVHDAHDALLETIDVETPIVARFYLPGDRLTCGPDARDVLGIRRDPRSVFIIDRVAVNYEQQSTHLHILRTRRRP